MSDGRFERQVRFAPLGREGQARLGEARVLLVGCGALGGALAQSLVRAGVGTLVIVDRDVVEESNLPRQVLFEARHAAERTSKVAAAAEVLARVGGPTRVVTHARHLDAELLLELADEPPGFDLLLDGTDNLPTRYLLNDLAVERGLPWVYGGVVGAAGLVMPVLPGAGPCLRCLWPDAPPAGVLPTCDTAGVLQPAVAAVAALQAGLALRLLARGAEGLEPALCEVDVWTGHVRRLPVPRDPECACCVQGDHPWLHRPAARPTTKLCGRNAVQVRGAGADLDAVQRALDGLARDVRRAGEILRFAVEDARVTLFADGRALVEGTEDEARAQALYDRYVGR